MNKKQLPYWWVRPLLLLLAAFATLVACLQKEESTPSPASANIPAPQPTPMQQGIGSLIVTERLDLDPNTDGNQKGISVHLTLSVPDPEVIKYQYFEISDFGGSVFVLSDYETPVGDVEIVDFSNPTVSFTKGGVNYVCPPVDPADPFVVDCGGVLSVLLSN